MIKVDCEYCGEELNAPGALLFSPPMAADCTKIHICKHCYHKIDSWIKSGPFWTKKEAELPTVDDVIGIYHK